MQSGFAFAAQKIASFFLQVNNTNQTLAVQLQLQFKGQSRCCSFMRNLLQTTQVCAGSKTGNSNHLFQEV